MPQPAAFDIKWTWDDVLSTYNPTNDGPLKPWLTKKYGANFGVDRIRAAAESAEVEEPRDNVDTVIFDKHHVEDLAHGNGDPRGAIRAIAGRITHSGDYLVFPTLGQRLQTLEE